MTTDDEYTKFIFPILPSEEERAKIKNNKLRDELIDLLEMKEAFATGKKPNYSPDACMRMFCSEPRYENTVLCEAHLGEVKRGERGAPPIRRHIDYISRPTRIPLFYDLPSDEKKEEDK